MEQQVSYISFGVVPNMFVPVIQGNTFVDHESKSINSGDQTVTFLSRETVLILRKVQKSPRREPNREAVCVCPRWGNARLVLTHKTLMRPGTIAHVQVRGSFQGHGTSETRAHCTPFMERNWPRGLGRLILASIQRSRL